MQQSSSVSSANEKQVHTAITNNLANKVQQLEGEGKQQVGTHLYEFVVLAKKKPPKAMSKQPSGGRRKQPQDPAQRTVPSPRMARELLTSKRGAADDKCWLNSRWQDNKDCDCSHGPPAEGNGIPSHQDRMATPQQPKKLDTRSDSRAGTKAMEFPNTPSSLNVAGSKGVE